MRVTQVFWRLAFGFCLGLTGCQLPNGWHTASRQYDPFLALDAAPHHSEGAEACGRAEDGLEGPSDHITARVPNAGATGSKPGRAAVSDSATADPFE